MGRIGVWNRVADIPLGRAISYGFELRFSNRFLAPSAMIIYDDYTAAIARHSRWEFGMDAWIETHLDLFSVFFVGMWVFICKILSLMGGWNALAGKYRSTTAFSGKKWSLPVQSAQLGLVSYGSCLTCLDS